VLEAHQYTVLEAETGVAALTAAATDRPDVIILDMGLPDMEGVEVTRRLREWTAVPILILSVREQETDKIAALDAGADDYLTSRLAWGNCWRGCG
jgi:two-component system KDP operon response regulator KdpE